MSRYFSTRRLWFRTIAVLLVCLFVLNESAFALNAGEPKSTLNPTLRTNPAVKINNQAGSFSITNATPQILSVLKAFKDDFVFGYVSVLIGDAIASDIGESGLAFFIGDNLPGMSIERFDLSRVQKEGGAFLVPYTVPGIERELKLRYTSTADKNDSLPVDILIGEVAVTIEGLSRPEKVSREYGDIDLVIAGIESGIKAEAEAVMDEGSAKVARDTDEGASARGANLDRATILQAILFSFIYLYWKIDPVICLGTMSSEFVLALTASVLVHEFIHILQILLMGKRASYLTTKVGLDGIEVKFFAESEGVAKTIILAAMVGSGALSTVFSMMSVFFDSSFFVLMGILNATFALAGRDLSNLQKGADFKGAPRKVYRAVKKVMGDFFRDKSSPVIVLMGGYFASGKSLLANKIKMHLQDKLNKRVFVVDGDNWLLSSDRRKQLSGEPIYPYNKYEIDKWKDMVQRASENLPILVPFYLTTFRSRLILPEEEFNIASEQTIPFKEDGYFLFSVGDIRDRSIREFLPPGYEEKLFKGIDKNWSQDRSKAKNIRRRLELLLDRPIKRYMINPRGDIYVDAFTGDLIEKLSLEKEDILIMEFEQAISFPDINKLADVHAFVDASFLHRKEYFMGRRKHGERYADLSEVEAEERMLSLLENEEELAKKKVAADLVVYNDERLEESVMYDVVRSRRMERKKHLAEEESEAADADVLLEEASVKAVMDKFLDMARTKAYSAARKGEKVLIAIDTSWVPDLQKNSIQHIVTELQRLADKGKLGGMMVVRGNGTALRKEIDAALRSEAGLSVPNMILMGDENVLQEEVFSDLRPDNDNEGAFFSEISVPETFPETGYTNFIEMLTISVKEALSGGERVHRFILKARPMDFDSLRQLYDRQSQFLVAA